MSKSGSGRTITLEVLWVDEFYRNTKVETRPTDNRRFTPDGSCHAFRDHLEVREVEANLLVKDLPLDFIHGRMFEHLPYFFLLQVVPLIIKRKNDKSRRL